MAPSDPVYNRFMLKLAQAIKSHSARILMGDANMSMFAGESVPHAFRWKGTENEPFSVLGIRVEIFVFKISIGFGA